MLICGSHYMCSYTLFVFLVVLCELPLPKKAKKEVINLLPNSKTHQDAWKLIEKHDIKLTTQLAHALSQVNTDHL